MALSHNYPQMSVDEYFQWDQSHTDERYEYIDGHILLLAGGTLNHATIATNLIILLGGAVRGSSCHVFTSDARVRLSEQRYVYPDATVSCDKRDRGERDAVQFPRLVVEVLSPSTEAYDRGRKLAYYRDCPSILEYLLVNTHIQEVELYRREKQTLWTYRVFQVEDKIELISIGGIIPVTDLYDNVLFPDDEDDPA